MKNFTTLILFSFCVFTFAQNRDLNPIAGDYATNVESTADYSNFESVVDKNLYKNIRSDDGNLQTAGPLEEKILGSAPVRLLYYNGPFWNIPGTPNISLLQDTTLGMSLLGSGAQVAEDNTVAEDFIITQEVIVTSIDVFAYKTGAIAPSIDAVYCRIWNGDPSAGGASVIWGNLSTNVIGIPTNAHALRQSESNPGDTRQITRVPIITSGLTLAPGTYWIEYNFDSTAAGSGPWAPLIPITGEAVTGNALHSNAGVWTPLMDDGTSTQQGLPFMVYGEYMAGSTFPTPYCGVSYNNEIEPITMVYGAGIQHTTSEIVNDSPSLEDFTLIEGAMVEGLTYEFILKGNTNGNYKDSFSIFIDWDQDGYMDSDSERYEIGFVINSTGIDDQQASGFITVPPGVTDGPTRMRVMKEYGPNSPSESCTGASFGQAEDYTIIINAIVGISDNNLSDFTYYPNPTSGNLFLVAKGIIDSVAIYNILGQKVLFSQMDATSSILDLSNLQTGTYLMQVSSKGQTGTYRILKE